MQCVLCGRALLTAAVSIPTRGGPISYGPKCARKAGLLQKAGQRTTHTQKTPPQARKAQANTIGRDADTHTLNLFEETAC